MSRVTRFRQRATVLYRRLRAVVGRGLVTESTRVVVHNPDDTCPDPIFLIGTHRSGTSLLRRLVNSHPNIACPPESFFLRHYTPLLQDPQVFDGLRGLGFDEAGALRGLRAGASHFHEAYRRAKGKARWADKTPQYVSHLETLWRLFSPGARFVFIFRHPLDVAYSQWQRGWRLGDAGDDLLTDVAIYVRDRATEQLAFLDDHPDRTYTLHYERLVAAPEEETRALCDFLGEPWTPVMLAHHQQQHDYGTEDPIARGTRGFQPSLGNWRGWSPAELTRATSLLDDVMARLGYAADRVEPLRAPGASELGRARRET